jgi:hypothetical protein
VAAFFFFFAGGVIGTARVPVEGYGIMSSHCLARVNKLTASNLSPEASLATAALIGKSR